MPEDIYDAYGLLYVANKELKQGLVDTVGVLRSLVSGELSAGDIKFTDNGFTLETEEVPNG